MISRKLITCVTLALCCASSVSGQTLEWTRQPDNGNQSRAVSADVLGNVFITGWTGEVDGNREDQWLSKYDASGTFQWTRQFGADGNDWSRAVSADRLGTVYIAGAVDASDGGTWDAFINKYDDSGTLQWTRKCCGSTYIDEYGVSADGLGNVYNSGGTRGDLDGTNAGGVDAFLAKYDEGGSLQWTRQLGTSADDVSQGVSADRLGNVFISGRTDGSLYGSTDDNPDAFVSKFDESGRLQWGRQLEISGEGTASRGVSADGLGNIYAAGSTRVDGSLEPLVAKYVDLSLNADFDFDGDVDGDAFIRWQIGLGDFPNGGAQKSDGDYDVDGDVDGDDFLGWQVEFGSGSGPASAVVPEPASAILAVVVAVVGMLSRRVEIGRLLC